MKIHLEFDDYDEMVSWAIKLLGIKREEPSKGPREQNVFGSLSEIETAGFSTRVVNMLKCEGIHKLEDLASMREFELLSLPGFGRTSMMNVKSVLAQHGLSLTVPQPFSLS